MLHRLLEMLAFGAAAALPFDGPCVEPRDIHPVERGPLTEPSGLVFHPGRGTIFAVDDEGRVAEMRPDGRLVMWLTHGRADLEGITLGPDGNLWVVVEDPPALRVLGPDLRVRREIPIEPDLDGERAICVKKGGGLEGLAWCPETKTFFVVNQLEPARLLELDVPDEGKGGPARIKRIVAELEERVGCASDLMWDAASKRFLVTSSSWETQGRLRRAGKVWEVGLDGTILGQRRLPGTSQEGLCLDADGNAYIACDTGGILRCEPYRR